MRTVSKRSKLRHPAAVLLAVLVLTGTAQAWWDKAWTGRAKVTVDTSAESGFAVTEALGSPAVLLRLHEGNFPFLAVQDTGADLRFVDEDDKTLLPYHIEKYDGLLNEAFVWVKVPKLEPGKARSIWMYYGNATDASNVQDAAATFEEGTTLVYHFAEQGAPAVDSSGAGNTAAVAGLPSAGSIIGSGLRLDGQSAVSVPGSESLNWAEGGTLTWSAWVKSAASQPDAVIFGRREGAGAFVVGVDSGVPYVEIRNASGTQRSPAGEPMADNAWAHLAVTVAGNEATLFVNGKSYAVLNAGLPALKGELQIGGPAPGGVGFIGEIDELRLASVARPAGALQLAAVGEGTSADAQKLIVITPDEEGGGGGHSAALEHVMLFGDIAKNMMFDGWIAVGICVVMCIFGWGVAVQKFNYLNSIQKGSEAFMHQWHKVSTDLTALDREGGLGEGLDAKTLKLVRKSPLYHLYHIGSHEIESRVGKDRSKGLSARSIQAIRASLETGLVQENQRMNKGLIFLTVSIAGGPYVGLLGTVVGVMITFAIIAKSGEVDVNSIAPGIASALLATVAGLVVAIPALFIYSFLSSRIKDLLASMQVFIDEFIAKMAEFYPTPGEGGAVPVSANHSSIAPSLDPSESVVEATNRT